MSITFTVTHGPGIRYIKQPTVFSYHVYQFLGRMADFADDVMRMLRIVPGERPAIDFAPSDINQLSDEDLLDFLDADPEGPTLSEVAGVELHDEHVSRWSDGTVLKVTAEREQDDDIPEAIAMESVFRHTLIPVPRVRRAFREDTTGYIWMDYIRGRQLKFVWPTLSILGKLRVAFVLRRYIRQLRERGVECVNEVHGRRGEVGCRARLVRAHNRQPPMSRRVSGCECLGGG
ncbi:hypothetical protein NUW54_g10019 [Trametes sanguinea]|uniref:Uncharacterized protein n=1 Tax=Trametes sanguinea TaxID=158606 RepID=A0ACC1P3C5_9APHY|nr:hypothetical protein NUW54_g10019 [Trametes sanguinea]